MLKITYFVIIYLGFILAYEIRNVRKRKVHHNAVYWVFKIAFYLYVLLLVNVTIFPIPVQKLELESLRRNFGEGLEINLIPMRSIINIVKGNVNFSVKLRQIGGNLILLCPLAFYLPLVRKKFREAKKVFLLLLVCSCAIELMQFFIGKVIGYRYRAVDIDDIILNVCGGMAGFLAWKILEWGCRKKQ